MSAVREEPQLPAPMPMITHDSTAYWAAAREGTLLLSVCPDCERVIWYPKPLCAACGGVATEWRPASGRGTVHSYSIIAKGVGTYANAGPYVVAIVELDEGPRMITNIVDSDLERVAVGAPVEVVFDVAGDDAALPRFVLT